MIPVLKRAVVGPNCGPTEPRVLSVSVCGRKVLCGALGTAAAVTKESRERVKHRLASALGKRHWELNGDRNASRIGHSFVLRKNELGKPSLGVDAPGGLSISFTHVPGTSWGALCDGAQVGIDTTEFSEFEEGYPFHRAFHGDENLHSLAGVVGTIQEAASLIWSAKESAVKAVGFGFHLVDPLEAKVRTILLDGRRASSEVRFECNRDEMAPHGPGTIAVRSFRYKDGWISIALAAWPPSTQG